MSVPLGTRLGPYEVIAPLGAGGMGEVYRARDSRLGRDVALKVLPGELSADMERLSRFEREARAASALNNPHIVTIYDIGQADSISYMAMELVEGRTLREVISPGPVPSKRLFAIAAQVADGLARAHAAGIVHRDLKPENVMVTRDGLVKILDFGLAKLTQPQLPSGELTQGPTVSGATQPGIVLGTVGYMSPEQASGHPLDFRSDQFSFGAVLYEMATGRRAFQRDTPVQTLSAIIQDEPEPITNLNPSLPAPFLWVVETCLAKDPEDRYASTRDLARELQRLRDQSSEPTLTGTARVAAPARALRRFGLLAAGLALPALLAAFFLGRRTASTPPPSYQRLTFGRGVIWNARFAPDGQTIVYGAAWDGKPFELFSSRAESPDSRPLGIGSADILAISPRGEMALSLGAHFHQTFSTKGTLARAPLGGGAARPILEDVAGADWAPDGQSLAVAREVGRSRLEFPIGKVLYEATGWISCPRVSPNGELVAFFDHPVYPDPSASVAVIDRNGSRKILSPDWRSGHGLAWSPDGHEVWFTAGKDNYSHALYAVSLGGEQRLVGRVAGSLVLHDVARDGRVLMAREDRRSGIRGLLAGDTREHDLSLFDHSVSRDLSADGKALLFFAAGDAGGKNLAVYLRKTDGPAPVRLGEGLALGLSPDGEWALSLVTNPPPAQLVLLPTGVGEPKQLTRDAISHHWGNWFPDGKRILFLGSEPNRGTRLYVQDLVGGRPRPISPEGVAIQWHALSPDGKWVAARAPNQKISLYPVGGAAPLPVPGLDAADQPLRWTADGRSLYVYRRHELPARVFRVEVATGRRTLWKELMPPDPAGLVGIVRIQITPDERFYSYSYSRSISDLYLVRGLK